MFKDPMRNITNNLDSLRDFVDLLGSYLDQRREDLLTSKGAELVPLAVAMITAKKPDDQSLDIESLRKSIPEIPEFEIVKTNNPKEYRITINQTADQNVLQTMMDFIRSGARSRLLYNSSLMNLTSIVELFFSEMLHTFFRAHPETIGTKEKVFSLADLAEFESIEGAREHHVISKIEELLYGSFLEWVTYLRTNFKLSMGYLDPDLKVLAETFQRRNLIVHNGGVVNSLYLRKVDPSLTEGVTIGKNLSPDKGYLDDRIDRFERNCLLIAAEWWKKVSPADAERGDVLAAVSARHLERERWNLVESLSRFSMGDKQMPEAKRLTATLNYWFAKKRNGTWSEVESEVREADFSTRDANFQLRFAAVTGDSETFFRILPNALHTNAVKRKELDKSPIFSDFRSDSRWGGVTDAPTKGKTVRTATRKRNPPKA